MNGSRFRHNDKCTCKSTTYYHSVIICTLKLHFQRFNSAVSSDFVRSSISISFPSYAYTSESTIHSLLFNFFSSFMRARRWTHFYHWTKCWKFNCVARLSYSSSLYQSSRINSMTINYTWIAHKNKNKKRDKRMIYPWFCVPFIFHLGWCSISYV